MEAMKDQKPRGEVPHLLQGNISNITISSEASILNDSNQYYKQTEDSSQHFVNKIEFDSLSSYLGGSGFSCFFMNEVKESSSNSSVMSNYSGYQNSGGFSWESENKLEKLLQFETNQMKNMGLKGSSEEETKNIETQMNSASFGSYPLMSMSENERGGSFGVFHNI
ncbi:hypothetical protein SDJN02_14127 [Cucurbita argyrosperma subsp. argyrosperma]|nr:hypothetical protein SDJN02_14127 [Cucurbita argyrosperma subsp. argyrosperma]